MVPYFALAAFAGVRSDVKETELIRLLWNDVRLKPTQSFPHGHIQRRADIAKKGKRRLIAIQPNLAAWLQQYSRKTGRVVPEGARAKRERVCKATADIENKIPAIAWKKN